MPFRKKGSKNWHYDFQYRGRRFSGSCQTPDFEEAKIVEAQARLDARQDKQERGEYTISQAFGTYFADVCEPQASAATSASQARMLLEHFDPTKLISTLTNKDLLKYVVKARATESNGYVNRKLEFFSRAIRHMGDFYNANLPDLDFSKVKTKEPQEVIRELTADEEARLFKHLRPDLHPMVWCALNTGARQKALFNLRWRDVGDSHLLLAGDGQGKPPYRFLITRPLRAFLSAQPRVVSGHVLTWLDRNGNRRPFNQNNHWMWDRAFKAAKIEDFRFHDFRHTFATRMLRHTGNLKLVQRLLGHKRIETTLKYAHVLDADLDAALEAFYDTSTAVSPAEVEKTNAKQ